MREISVIEMNEVSGAYSWNSNSGIFSNILKNGAEAVASVALAASLGVMGGMWMGGKHGGDGGGIFGFGLIGMGVGLVVGGVVAGASLGIAGGILGWDVTVEYALKGLDALFNGTLT